MIENKNYRKDKNTENDSKTLHSAHSSHNINERTYGNSDMSNVDMYATLPRKGRQLAMKNQNQNSDLYKNCLNRQQRNSSPSVHQPSSRSSTPSSECRDSDSSSQASDQYRMQIPSHQQVKMNKAEIRQLLHNNMVQRQGHHQPSTTSQNSQCSGNPQAEVCKTRIIPPLSAKSQPIVPPRAGRVVEPSAGGQPTELGQGMVGKMVETKPAPSAVLCNKFRKSNLTRHASFGGSSSGSSAVTHATLDRYASQTLQTPARSYIQSNIAGTNPSHSKT